VPTQNTFEKGGNFHQNKPWGFRVGIVHLHIKVVLYKFLIRYNLGLMGLMGLTMR
jgi:hypothetical protein